MLEMAQSSLQGQGAKFSGICKSVVEHSHPSESLQHPQPCRAFFADLPEHYWGSSAKRKIKKSDLYSQLDSDGYYREMRRCHFAP